MRRVTAAAVLLLAVVLLIRLPLWTLAGLGRDEAIYRYWAHHPDLSYAPLLQGTIRLFEILGTHSAWTLRLPMALLGFLVLFLVDLRLRRVNAPTSTRFWIGLTVAATPWQAFSGSILHPDNFLVVTLLLFVLSVWNGRVLTVGLCAWMMILAKPTGIVLLPVAWWMVGRLGATQRWRVHLARSLLVGALIFFVWTMKLDMLRGMATFGHLDSSLSPLTRLGTSGVALLFLGGPVLIYFAIQGLRERLTRLGQGSTAALRREAEVTLASASVLIVFFLAAAVTRGQFKPNWVLPAAVLLLPLATTRVPRLLLIPGLGFSLLASAGQSLVMRNPDLVDRTVLNTITGEIGTGLKAYAVHGSSPGPNDTAAQHWRDYMEQYNNAAGFAKQIREAWNLETGTESPNWIVSDDYGLAAQLHWYLDRESAHLVLVGDKTFCRTVAAFEKETEPGPILLLPVAIAGNSLSSQVEVVASLPEIFHPATGRPLTPLLGRRVPMPIRETSDEPNRTKWRETEKPENRSRTAPLKALLYLPAASVTGTLFSTDKRIPMCRWKPARSDRIVVRPARESLSAMIGTATSSKEMK